MNKFLKLEEALASGMRITCIKTFRIFSNFMVRAGYPNSNIDDDYKEIVQSMYYYDLAVTNKHGFLSLTSKYLTEDLCYQYYHDLRTRIINELYLHDDDPGEPCPDVRLVESLLLDDTKIFIFTNTDILNPIIDEMRLFYE